MTKRTEDQKRRRKLTPRERVLKKYPLAFAGYSFGSWDVFASASGRLLSGDLQNFTTPRSAWADAARRLK